MQGIELYFRDLQESTLIYLGLFGCVDDLLAPTSGVGLAARKERKVVYYQVMSEKLKA